MAQREIESKINKFIQEAKRDIAIDKVILFGSYVKANQKKWSDLDLAVISKDFYGMDAIKRLTLLGKIAWRVKATEIEALGYTPKEYREAGKFDFLYEIKRTGKIIF